MKNIIKTILLLFLPFIGLAQDSVINISPEKFSKNIDAFNIDAIDGWVFHKGNDSLWAKKDMDTKGWEKLKPTDLSAKYADKNGRVEGWFRIKVRFDSSLLNKVLYVDFGQWASTAFYVDGELLATRGNTGEKRKDFREYNGGLDPLSIRFDTPAVHILSLHYVGYLSAIPPYDVKTQSMKKVIRLGGPNYSTRLSNNYKKVYTFLTSWVVICAILSVLFWLLLFQNPKEKNLFWIALYTSTVAIYTYCWAIDPSGRSFNEYRTYFIIGGLIQIPTIQLLLPILLIKVFKRKINSRLLLILIIFIIINEIGAFLTNSFETAFYFIYLGSVVFVFGICLYYVITSWKSLKGAQWAIVGGLIFTISVYLIAPILDTLIPNIYRSQYFNLLNRTVFTLGFPFSLLIYVSMRFKEMIQEVQVNAQKVVELSEEKKEQAITQQKILEEEVARQTGEIRQTLANLKSTQSQLIQSEKMASLGELTAGIAHEIQNPLNFVNNFSEVTNELIDEMNEELNKGDVEEAKSIASDIKQNLQKITHHGKRADSIVKGMLQHSRSSSHQKEPTDINKLADEYLRLAYHGLRAKDKSFNAELITNYDANLPLASIVPQDIGRVFLNLLTNAFYAVQDREKKEKVSGTPFKPTVKLSTSTDQEFIIIKVEDNGSGIPEQIKEKVMQPFFTTKPTGEGTGLGLSMSYDIVVEAHGGTIKINSEEGEFTEFTITIPIEPKTTNS
ncbi:sensor histidine kinase [Daejeonella sp.]|uniref:sensor histidine kinase n=1 Tax=Daejeonella sp. TaxID=2805397 RepID=UPI002730C55C|nr:ATP-binding protein [Daejeonella sp.]MDP2414471.1 ATP-binding protein [Daejeonella sp.]